MDLETRSAEVFEYLDDVASKIQAAISSVVKTIYVPYNIKLSLNIDLLDATKVEGAQKEYIIGEVRLESVFFDDIIED